jgi:hypothetical protein
VADVQGNGRKATRSSYTGAVAAEAAEALDWNAFSARHFAGRARHDLEGVSAYGLYRQGRDWRKNGPPKTRRLHLVPNEPVSPAIETDTEIAGARRLLAAVTAVQVWEGEGGYTPESDERQGGRHG